MDKRQQEIVKIIKSCLPISCNGASYYCYGSIPKDKFRNACNEYAGYVDYSDCVGLTDETVFGSAKRGFLFTFDGFYYDGCSSKTYYTEGTQFNNLSSLYNLSAMNGMLEQLYQAATKKSGFETFLDVATTVAGGLLEQAAEEYRHERELREQQENEDTIEILKACKTSLKQLQSLLDPVVEQDYWELDTEDCLISFTTLFQAAAIFANDWEMYEQSGGGPLSEEDFDSTAEGLELMCDLLETEDEDHRPIRLRQAIQAFHSSMESVMDEMDDIGEDSDDDDAERLFEKAQRAAGKLRKKMKEAVSRINEMIELAYEEMDD